MILIDQFISEYININQFMHLHWYITVKAIKSFTGLQGGYLKGVYYCLGHLFEKNLD